MQAFQAILADFIRESAQIIEEFQAQCQSIAYEVPTLEIDKNYPTFQYCPGRQSEVFNTATDEDVEKEVLELSKTTPKALLQTTHFVTKVKNNLNSRGISATKVKIQRVFEKLKSSGKININEEDDNQQSNE